MNYIEKARKQRKIIETAVSSLPDKSASEAPALFPKLKYTGILITAGTRINWNGTLKRAAVDLWDREENNPDNSPVLWENIPYRDGIRIIPDVITAGLAFGMDELGWWGEKLYRSTLDNNVWTPEQNPSGWVKVEVSEE